MKSTSPQSTHLIENLAGGKIIPTPPEIRVAAVVLRDAAGRYLHVRKRGTSAWLFPGGKPEAGEELVATACRELWEELGLRLQPEQLSFRGEYVLPAANEAGFVVRASVFVFEGVLPGRQLKPQAEIAELCWLTGGWLDGGEVPADTTVAPLSVQVMAELAAEAACTPKRG